ncbi:MAG: hypothetical protein WCN95_10365 [bacterium]
MKTMLFWLFVCGLCAASACGAETKEDRTFEIYATRTNGAVQIFMKVTNQSDTPYEMERPHGGSVMPNYFRYHKSAKDGKYGQPIDALAPGERAKGPTITVLKGKPYHFKLYDLPNDLHVTMRVKYVLDSGKAVYTNELEI